MVKKMFIKSIALMVAVLFITGLFAACGNAAKEETTGTTAQGTTAEKTEATETTEATKPVEKTTVDFWYLWGGDDSKKIEDMITKYNQSQSAYEVKGLFVADIQKIKVAIAGGTGPDISDDFDGNVAQYADQGILEPLDEYIQKDNMNFDDYIKGAVDTGKYNGKIYALPCSVNFMMLYYNKTLLEKAGYANPPKTDKELLEMAKKATEVNADKSINVLGFPDFPFVYFHNNFTTAFGGKFYTDDGKFTPDSAESIAAINLVRNYRETFGLDNVLKFNQAGKYVDATDPFVTGNQVFRVDGFWLAGIIRNTLKVGQDKLDFGIIPFPYPDGKPELAKRGEIASSIFYISANAKSKLGAWDFMKFMQNGEFSKALKAFPVLKSLLNDPLFADLPGFKEFSEYANTGTFVAPYKTSLSGEVSKAYGDELELAVTFKKTAEEAMKAAAEKGNKLLGK